ncbi:MAG: branched-chain amino acid ABC transporter permease [Bacillota bacterium]|nr:MAG: branched-chain amino acid ABC transporter permease [Bacillota bacterium]
MGIFTEQLINGLTLGSIYALIALGYTMVYGIMRLINFAHGELFMLGAYIGFTLLVSQFAAGAGPGLLLLAVVVLAAMIAVAVVGVTVERVAYRPLRRSHRLTAVVSALGASILLQNAAMLLWGKRYQAYPVEYVPAGRFELLGVHFTAMQLIILATAFVLMLALYFFVQRTAIGMAIRATAIDHDTARLMGIDINQIIRLVFIIGPALGAAAGVMIGLYYRQIHYTMGWAYGLKAFTAAIMGGIGNIPGAMVGGLLLGVLEMLGAGYLSSAWKDAFVFMILIGLLILRPHGLLGERVAEKV